MHSGSVSLIWARLAAALIARCVIFLAIAIAAGWPIAPAMAGAPVQVTPVQFVIEKGRPIVTMTVKSSANKKQLFQIDLRKWAVADGDATLLANDQNLIVTPPVFEIEGGATQIVRLGMIKPIDTSMQEQAWRVILRDITPADAPDGVSTMMVRMNISMPIFVPADNPQPLSLTGTAQLTEDWSVALSFENPGNRHAHIVEAILLDKEGTAIVGRGLSHYVLPGQSSRTLVHLVPEDEAQQQAIDQAQHIKLTTRNHVSKEVAEFVLPLQNN